jgi:nucleolar protein 12
VTEEELRQFFSNCGQIENIRVIRDPHTHLGKGIGYITFAEEAGFKQSLLKNKSKFKDRELRIKKAVPVERLEKKKMKKTRGAERRMAERKNNKALKEEEVNESDMKALLENEDLKERDIED